MYDLNGALCNFHDNKISMYLWNETIASRALQEVALCCLILIGKIEINYNG